MPQQLEIDWNNIVHGQENNRHSQLILEEQYERLSNNCKKLYNALKSGGKWTGKRIVLELNMLEYRRRLKDLIDAGIPIQSRVLQDGAKEWWIEK